MPATPKALLSMPPQIVASLEKLGADMAVARLRRRETLKDWAARVGVSVPTLLRLEAGDPGVGLGIVATNLWLLGLDARLADLASPEHDRGALELDVRAAEARGLALASRSAEARIQRERKLGASRARAAGGETP